VDVASEQSFPASDPPAWMGAAVVTKEDERDEADKRDKVAAGR
jgi:hypothetical protein